MGKYSDFPRSPNDRYLTPLKAALPLRRFLTNVATFAEPCSADGRLIRHVESFGPLCIHSGDIQDGVDALTDPALRKLIVDVIITNPPYVWAVLKAMLELFPTIAPTWLLLEATFKHKVHAVPFMELCSDIVSVGQIRWFEGTKCSSFEHYAWYRFDAKHTGGTLFHPRQTFPAIRPERPAAAA